MYIPKIRSESSKTFFPLIFLGVRNGVLDKTPPSGDGTVFLTGVENLISEL